MRPLNGSSPSGSGLVTVDCDDCGGGGDDDDDDDDGGTTDVASVRVLSTLNDGAGASLLQPPESPNDVSDRANGGCCGVVNDLR